MGQCVIVDGAPVPSHKGRYQENERALRLVEVGNEKIHKAEGKARDNDDARTGNQFLQAFAVQVIDNRLQASSVL